MNRNNLSCHNNNQDTENLTASFSNSGGEINEPENDGNVSFADNKIFVINIKVKFLNDTIRRITDVNLEETVLVFKQKYFSNYLERGQYIKLIFHGRMLNDEDQLSTYNIINESVIHCIVRNRSDDVQREELVDSTESHSDIDTNHGFFNIFWMSNDNQFSQLYQRFIGFSAFLLLGLLEAFFIYIRTFYAHLFSLAGTFMLIIISFGFGIMIYGRFFHNR